MVVAVRRAFVYFLVLSLPVAVAAFIPSISPVAAATAPSYTVAHYLQADLSTDEADAEYWACTDPAVSGEPIILDFGAPSYSSSTPGVQESSSQDLLTNSDVADVVNYYFTGWNASSVSGTTCGNHSSMVAQVAVGTSNGTSNTTTQIESGPGYTGIADDWAYLVDGSSYGISPPTNGVVEGASDVEQGSGFLGSSQTLNWVAGFNSKANTTVIMWDYGTDSGGDNPSPETPGQLYAIASGNGVTESGTYYDYPHDSVLPEIYSGNYDGLADDWVTLSCYMALGDDANVSGTVSPIEFQGVTADTTANASTSWDYLYNESDSTSETDGGSGVIHCSNTNIGTVGGMGTIAAFP